MADGVNGIKRVHQLFVLVVAQKEPKAAVRQGSKTPASAERSLAKIFSCNVVRDSLSR